jgi:radical SAM protein with 4Fe4S-binding SPASM domain
MTPGFANRLVSEYEELARDELGRMKAGKRPRVGNFLEAMASLESGRVRSLPCGAGSRYLSVSADGGLFLCHRFGGDAAHAVGDVSDGIDRRKVRSLLGRFGALRRRCESCWARWLCGGPCYYDLKAGSSLSTGPGASRCVVRARILELAMWLYASLPPSDRERVIGSGSAGGRERPRTDRDGAPEHAQPMEMASWFNRDGGVDGEGGR